MLLLGHRGASRYAAENTIQAFDRALEHGCDGIEFDVRITADRQAVICHDERHERVEIASARYEASAAIQELPLLRDVLCRYGYRAFVYIELKVKGMERETLGLLREYPPQCGYVVASFLPPVLTAMYELCAGVPLGMVASKKNELDRWPDVPSRWVMLRSSLVSASLVDVLHSAEKKVCAWTLNTASEMRTMAALGVDGLLSDDTVLAANVFGRRMPSASSR